MAVENCKKCRRHFRDLVFIKVKEHHVYLRLTYHGLQCAIGNLQGDVESVAIKIIHTNINNQLVSGKDSER